MTMRLLMSFILIASAAKPAFASSPVSDEMNDIRLRPSYVKLYEACRASTFDFKLDSYYQAYAESLKSGLEFLTLSESGVTALMTSKGQSPYLHRLLENPTTSIALQDCLGGMDEEFAFVRNMLIADSTGKFVAIAIATVAIRAVGKVAGTAIAALRVISPTLARRATVAFVVASSAYALGNIAKERFAKEEARDESLPDIEAASSKSIMDAALFNLNRLQELAADNDLSSEDRARIQTEIQNWNIVIEEFKPRA